MGQLGTTLTKMRAIILLLLACFCGILTAQKGVISIPSNPTTGQVLRFDGTKYDTSTTLVVGNVGSTANAKGATFTGSTSTLVLQPASQVFKGVIGLNQIKIPLRMELVDGNTDVPAPAILTKEVIRIPLEYNGYSLIGVNYSVRTTGLTGDLDVQIRKNGSGTAGATFNAGQGQKDITLTGITVATGDLIDVEIITNSMATPQKGLWVTLILSPN